MLLTKNYLSPQIFGHYWYDKPIFYYWELIVGFKLFGITNFGARFFSSLLALCNIFLIYRFVKSTNKPRYCSCERHYRIRVSRILDYHKISYNRYDPRTIL